MSITRLYLDTSALRQLGRTLPTLQWFPRCKTSVVTLIELLNGVRRSDDEYARRRATIRLALNSGLTIDWTMPENRLYGAFREIDFNESRSVHLEAVLEHVANSVDRSEFIRNLKKAGSPYGIEFWETYDTEFGREFIDATTQGNKEIRRVFEADRSGIEQLGIGIQSSATLIEFCQALNENGVVLKRSTTLDALAEAAARLCDPSPSEQLLRRLYESYDGSIDPFLDAFSWSSINMAATASSPGRNDALDLAHFLYIRNGDTLVSNDSKMNAVAQAVGMAVLTSGDLH